MNMIMLYKLNEKIAQLKRELNIYIAGLPLKNPKAMIIE